MLSNLKAALKVIRLPDFEDVDWGQVGRVSTACLFFAVTFFWAFGVWYLAKSAAMAPEVLMHLLNPFIVGLFLLLVSFTCVFYTRMYKTGIAFMLPVIYVSALTIL